MASPEYDIESCNVTRRYLFCPAHTIGRLTGITPIDISSFMCLTRKLIGISQDYAVMGISGHNGIVGGARQLQLQPPSVSPSHTAQYHQYKQPPSEPVPAMTGRRLVDLFALVNVSSSIARGHFLLRSQQLNVYATTSSVLKSFRPRPSIARPRTPQTSAQLDDASSVSLKEGIEQDHFYTPEASTTIDPEPRTDLYITQNEAGQYPLPDEAIPPSNPRRVDKPSSESSSRPTRSHPLPDKAKRLQNASESSIPNITADPPSGDVMLNASPDVFYLRQARVSSVLSNLPRKKIPRQTEGEQIPTSAGKINADVFYKTPGQVRDARELPEKVTVLQQEDEGLNTGVFHSRRAKTILSQSTTTTQPGEPKQKVATTPDDTTRLTEGKNKATSYVRKDGDEVPSSSNAGVVYQEPTSKLPRDGGEHTGTTVEQASLSEMSALSLLPSHLLFYLIL